MADFGQMDRRRYDRALHVAHNLSIMAPLSNEDLRFRLRVSALLSCFLLELVLTSLLAIYFPKYLLPATRTEQFTKSGLSGGAVSAVCIALCRWLANGELSRRDDYMIYTICAIVPLLVRVVFALDSRYR
ncbi:hypothetical protein GGR53DRAFT_470001 [Hypoxylon sp. FL1150]|nr:hypothetical protein GGR53DRAFT_470001 [Hypoxylon sp. FL1150]